MTLLQHTLTFGIRFVEQFQLLCQFCILLRCVADADW